MKTAKIVLSLLALFLAFLTVLIPLVKEYHVTSVAAETKIFPLPKPGNESTASAMPILEVDYYLAYPGILPDHPLYWLKMIRDKISLSLTSGEPEKTDKLFLYADKRIGAAAVLVKGGKQDLGVSTATKAEKYFSQAVETMDNLQKNGQLTAIMLNQALKASFKHQQLLIEMMAGTQGEEKKTLQQALDLSKQNAARIKQIQQRE